MQRCVVAATIATATAVSDHSAYEFTTAKLEDWTFERYAREFGRDTGSAEYATRAALFSQALSELRVQRAQLAARRAPWQVDIHPFMDWSQEERATLNGGYKPSGARPRAAVVALQTGSGSNTTRASFESRDIDDPAAATMRSQGACGSCWAISAAEAVEAQLRQQEGVPELQISAQALVDCVPNLQHCGGSGGCQGATGELAFKFMRDVGVPLEDDLPYNAETDGCPVGEVTPSSAPWPSKHRVRVSGWTHWPSNQGQGLMNALVQRGPTVVAVDASHWHSYSGGIFDGCDKDATLGHAVLATGYGEELGKKYWRVQNSWSSSWGERGHVRVLRHDSDSDWCGTDKRPDVGEGCEGGPSQVEVCGMCGILYDPISPEGARIENSDAAEAGVSFGQIQQTDSLLSFERRLAVGRHLRRPRL